MRKVPILRFQHEHVRYVRCDVEGAPSAQRDVEQHVLHDEGRRARRGAQRGREHCVQHGVLGDVGDVLCVLRGELMDNARLHS